MKSTLREMQDFLTSSFSQPRFWGIFLAMVMLFAIIGPFGTFDSLNFPTRLVYWLSTMLGSWLLAMLSIAFVFAVLRTRIESALMIMMIGATIAAFPIAGYLHLVVNWFIDLPDRLGYWYQFLYALPISLTFCMVVWFAISEKFAPQDAFDNETENQLLKRLPPEKRGPVKYLCMQDHYVNVVTTRGTELVLMRMADAVASLNPNDGLQIHRSHWVSKSHVSMAKRESGKPIVVMDDDTELPVSRSYVKAARDAGII